MVTTNGLNIAPPSALNSADGRLPHRKAREVTSRQLTAPHAALALVTTPFSASTVMRFVRLSDVCHSFS
jgi:hypothetical protein